MNLSLWCQNNPRFILLLLVLTVLAGGLALFKLPLQLMPNVDLPEISIQTDWRAASPREMETQIAVHQEKVLQGIPGLRRMQTDLIAGSATINLTFHIDTNMNETLVDVVSRLSRTPDLPGDAEEPVITANGVLNGRVVGTFIIKTLPGNDRHVNSYVEYVEDAVIPRFRKINGVAAVSFDNALRKEVRITVDPFLISHLDISVPMLSQSLSERKGIAGGVAEVGRRQFTVRLNGADNIEDLGASVIQWKNGQPVYLRDIANIRYQNARQTLTLRQNGRDALMLVARRTTGSNVVDILDQAGEVINELNQGDLQAQGLSIENSLDTSVFIRRAVSMVFGNLLLGVFLAITVLWVFLKDTRLTFALAASIPVSLLLTLIVLQLFNLSLNVISLAGLAFAVGLILDASIVIAASAIRAMRSSHDQTVAIANGVGRVSKALIASTITTVAVLMPVLFIGDIEGQIFRDLAISLIAGVSISLVVAMTLLPMLLNYFSSTLKPQRQDVEDRWGIAGKLMRLIQQPARRLVLIVGLLVLPVVGSWLILPKADYLPRVNYDQLGVVLAVNPGYNLPTLHQEIGDVLDQRLLPYLSGDKQPTLKNFLVYMAVDEIYLGIRFQDPDQINQMIDIVKNEITQDFTDVELFVFRTPIFSNFGIGRSIDIDIQSKNLTLSTGAARAAMEKINEIMPDTYVSPVPGLINGEPELRLNIKEARVTELGLSYSDLGDILKMYTEGLYIYDFFDGSRRRDVILDIPDWTHSDELLAMPVSTHSDLTVPLSELANLDVTTGPRELRRVDNLRTITLQVTPPDEVSLEDSLNLINSQVLPLIRDQLGDSGVTKVSGSADRLSIILEIMGRNFIYALILLLLLLSVLFRSIRDGMVVLLTIPLALFGAILALHAVNLFTFQSLDLLTMVGFIVLLGLVVNNAVLLINETRQNETEGLPRNQALMMAIQSRLRPILLTALTSIFGMLPMLLSVADGAQVYRGIAAVIVGGMTFNTLLVFLLLPALLYDRKDREPAVDIKGRSRISSDYSVVATAVNLADPG